MESVYFVKGDVIKLHCHGGFQRFFSFQMMKTGIADQHIIYIVITALLLICSPIALLYSLEKNDRMLLITLPIKRRTMFWAKYRFYSGLLAGGFILIAMIVGLISSQPISLMTFLQCIELLLMGAFIRLTSDEKGPLSGGRRNSSSGAASQNIVPTYFVFPILSNYRGHCYLLGDHPDCRADHCLFAAKTGRWFL